MQELLYIITVICVDYKKEWTNQRLPSVSRRSLCNIRKNTWVLLKISILLFNPIDYFVLKSTKIGNLIIFVKV